MIHEVINIKIQRVKLKINSDLLLCDFIVSASEAIVFSNDKIITS